MKTGSFYLLVALLCATSTFALESPLVYYRFNGNYDNDGANSATLLNARNAPSLTDDGKLGGALLFNGNGNVFMANADLLPTGNEQAVTVAMWFSPGDAPQNGWSTIWNLGSTANFQDLALFWDSAGDLHLSSSFNNYATGPSPFERDTWYFISARYDSLTKQGELFINGAPHSSFNSTDPVSFSYRDGETLVIGGQSGRDETNNVPSVAYDLPAGSRVDEVQVYSGLLSDEDIAYLYNNGEGRELPTEPTEVPEFSSVALVILLVASLVAIFAVRRN